MKDVSRFLLCRRCDVPHYDNCPRCEGYGVRHERLAKGKRQPINRDRAKRIRKGNAKEFGWAVCPECGSSPFGPPDQGQ